MKFNARFWLKFSLVNLLIVALLGVLLRYKIGFDFPYFDQRNIHRAHSRFAFIGWITHTIFVLIVGFLHDHNGIGNSNYKRIQSLLLCFAYALLLAYIVLGEGVISSVLLLLCVASSIVFTRAAYHDFKGIANNNPALVWFKAALVFNIVSFLGVVYEILILFFNIKFNERIFLASEYFFLHFQYNGFFVFACMGLAIHKAMQHFPDFYPNKRVFTLFLIAVIPAYFLSTLWAGLPLWLYTLVVLAALLQLLAWGLFLKDIRKLLLTKEDIQPIMKLLFLFIAMAFSTKVVLQLGSTLPNVSKLAFGFRHIVIAYLHLVLLAIITGFLLAYLHLVRFLQNTKRVLFALLVFFSGIFINEVLLAIQGIESFSYRVIPFANEMLLAAAILLLIGALMLAVNVVCKTKEHKLL